MHGLCKDAVAVRLPVRLQRPPRPAAGSVIQTHERGHASHSWQMHDLRNAQPSYPMNLAETTDVFFETIVRDKLLTRAALDAERMYLYVLRG